MPAELLKGAPLAKEIQGEILEKIETYKKDGVATPKIVALQTTSDPSADWYIGSQEKCAAKLGIRYERQAFTAKNQQDLIARIEQLNQDEAVHGIFVSMPLPSDMNADQVLNAIDPRKDVEGIHPTNLGLIVLRKGKLIPPTAYAAYTLLKSCCSEVRGKKAVVVGQSAIVGRPLQMLLGQDRVTTVVCNTGTSEADLKHFLKEADIVFACAGTPRMIKGEWLKAGVIAIDVGTTEVAGEFFGDFDFGSAKDKASFITPVPGGVGPLTTTMLMQNLISAHEAQLTKTSK